MADALEAFREETRKWLIANAPPSARAPLGRGEEACWGGTKEQRSADVQRWLDVNAERGWTAPTWPRAYGGGGLSKAEARILLEERKALGLRPPLVGFGLTMIGPLLLQEGSEQLKKEHLPRIVRGEIRWCQGYSEPGAGSDLASLQTKAVRDGDVYVVDGSKIWTSYADKSDWMFLLVRTEPNAKKHDGITFLLMDMATPGVTVRPIRLISGASPFCETFLSGVRVPLANVVGHENKGWSIARALLAHERTMISDVFREDGDTDKMVEAARAHLGDDGGKIADYVVRDRICDLEIDQVCFDLTLQRAKDSARAGQKPGHESSMFKLVGTELNQRRRDLFCSILGPQSLGWQEDPSVSVPGFEDSELTATRDWLRSRGNTIEGGTSEIQLDIIAKRVLALPDARRAKKEGT
ncbi:MAG TPA: acyl-CoA dehydrogenase family protein [Labilithrix sp.]|jgi:acyl-CoA dehydrogenase|nr:acyl-CoA dehydrogenase family protein [Labilithrix sp.]